MQPDVTLRMKLGRLGDASHRSHFRQQDFEQACFVQQLKTAPGPAFGQDAIQLIANPFGGDILDLRRLFLNRPLRFLFYGEAQACREPDRPQHSKFVLGETFLRFPYCPNQACLQDRARPPT